MDGWYFYLLGMGWYDELGVWYVDGWLLVYGVLYVVVVVQFDDVVDGCIWCVFG